MVLETDFQKKLIPELKRAFPGLIVLKNDEQYLSGIPDLTLLYKAHWAFLEVKKSYFEPYRPNQEYYLDKASEFALGLMICPENKNEVISELQREWGLC